LVFGDAGNAHGGHFSPEAIVADVSSRAKFVSTDISSNIFFARSPRRSAPRGHTAARATQS
jgi:hypothetical protein